VALAGSDIGPWIAKTNGWARELRDGARTKGMDKGWDKAVVARTKRRQGYGKRRLEYPAEKKGGNNRFGQEGAKMAG